MRRNRPISESGEMRTLQRVVGRSRVAVAVRRYLTNILALKMTFFPVEFWGIKIWQPEDQPLGCIGWQVDCCDDLANPQRKV